MSSNYVQSFNNSNGTEKYPDSSKTQEAYNCVANFLDSLEEQEIKEEILSESKNAKQKSKKNTMINLIIQVLTEKNDLHFRTIWIEIEKLVQTSRG